MLLFACSETREPAAEQPPALDQPATQTTPVEPADELVTIRTLTPGDRACYVGVQRDDGSVREEEAVFEFCDKMTLIGKRVRIERAMTEIMALSCEGDRDCPDRDMDGRCDYPDRDGDRLADCGEILFGTAQNGNDTDADGLPDLLEVRVGTNAIESDGQLDDDFDLVKNGIEAMSAVPSGVQRLRITAGFDGGSTVLLSVQDSGPGIPVEDRKRVFDPFFTTKADGTGLGLAVCLTVIENHGGRLRLVKSDSDGSIFELAMPVGGQRSPA